MECVQHAVCCTERCRVVRSLVYISYVAYGSIDDFFLIFFTLYFCFSLAPLFSHPSFLFSYASSLFFVSYLVYLSLMHIRSYMLSPTCNSSNCCFLLLPCHFLPPPRLLLLHRLCLLLFPFKRCCLLSIHF